MFLIGHGSFEMSERGKRIMKQNLDIGDDTLKPDIRYIGLIPLTTEEIIAMWDQADEMRVGIEKRKDETNRRLDGDIARMRSEIPFWKGILS